MALRTGVAAGFALIVAVLPRSATAAACDLHRFTRGEPWRIFACAKTRGSAQITFENLRLGGARAISGDGLYSLDFKLSAHRVRAAAGADDV